MKDQRGRGAEKPTQIPPRGWKDIVLRVKDRIKDDHTVLSAAGVSFFGFVALIPGLAAAISVYSLLADPTEVQRQLGNLMGNFPEEARQLVTDQMARLAGESRGALTWGTVASIALAVWTASSGMAHLTEAVNQAYDEKDERGFLARRALSLVFTLGAVVLIVVVTVATTIIGPWLTDVTGSSAVGWIARAFIAGATFMLALSVLYKVGPNRDDPKWQWVSVGSTLAVVMWLIASFAFQVWVSNFGSYNETYGSLAAVVILLLWLFITSFVVLFAAAVNSEIEHQTQHDTTKGPAQPMGQRGAVKADTLGEAR